MQATLVLLLTIMIEHTLALDHSWGWAGYNSTGTETAAFKTEIAWAIDDVNLRGLETPP